MSITDLPLAGSDHDVQSNSDDRIAVIGLSGRFPGARDITEFWHNLEQGIKVEQVLAGEARERVFAGFALDDNLCFDAEFFGLSPSEAAMMDPQHRVFLETAWQAMDDAGYSKSTASDVTGVFAAAGFNDYVVKHVGPHSYGESAADYFAMLIGNDKDFLASRVAYFLDLKGPATVVQSACSSGLLAVHQGIQSLLQGEIDLALTGGVSISLDLENGYYADEGGAMSPTGVIAPFSDQSNGIVGGNGVAALVLKRFEDAVADQDHIYAVIQASAVNNDGAERASFTSPSVQGQRNVLAQALHLSELTPADITYIEAHGTGTPLGDPIEFDAIKHVYGDAENGCKIGSAKANVGHLNTVSGLAGLIKAIGVMYRGVVPPMLNFTASNPMLEIENSRFSINTEAEKMPLGSGYAALSSFGFGGTNVHLILGPYLANETAQASRGLNRAQEEHRSVSHLCLLSAKTTDALQRIQQDFLQQTLSLDAANTAATLLHGRAAFMERCAYIASPAGEGLTGVTEHKLIDTSKLPLKAPAAPIFLFAGQGNQFAGMGHWLYYHRKGYKDVVDQCSEILQPLLSEDIRLRLFGTSDELLLSTRYTQLSLFITEYAFARLLIDAGIKPAAMLGHSIGEYVAACLAGVFSLRDALYIISERGRLIEQLEPSAMQLVPLSVDQVDAYIKTPDLSLAVINQADRCVVSGDVTAIAQFTKTMDALGVTTYPLAVSHGFHSHLLDPILAPFLAVCESIEYQLAQYPILSNNTGDIADPHALMTPKYWVDHLRNTVRFADNVECLANHWPGHLCLDLSPGHSMHALLAKHEDLTVLSGMRSQQQETDFLTLLGSLWVAGHSAVESLVLEERPWQRISLPSYPFERTVHVLPEQVRSSAQPIIDTPLEPESVIEAVSPIDVGYLPCWTSLANKQHSCEVTSRYQLYFINDEHDITPTKQRLVIKQGSSFSIASDGSIYLNPNHLDSFVQLLAYLKSLGVESADCYYGWLVDLKASFSVKAFGFDSLCRISQTLIDGQVLQSLILITQDLCCIQGAEKGADEQALAVGLLRTLPLEYSDIRVAWLDTDQFPTLVQCADVTLRMQHSGRHLASNFALREQCLYQRSMAELPLDLPLQEGESEKIKAGGTYLIVGGMGHVGRVLARALAEKQCHIIIMARTIPSALIATPDKDADLAYCLAQGARISLRVQSAADLEVMDRFVNECQRDHITIKGVFNLAGRYTKQVLQDMSLSESDTNYIAKVRTTQVLKQSLSPLKPDFLVNFSSLAAELPGYGNSDYMAANFYQNMMAQKRKGETEFPVISIAWDNWQNFGTQRADSGESSLMDSDLVNSDLMNSGDVLIDKRANHSKKSDLFSHQGAATMTDQQAVSLLWRIIDSGHRHLIIGLKPLSFYEKQIEKSVTQTRRQTTALLDTLLHNEEQEAGGKQQVNSPVEQVCLSLFQQVLGVSHLQLEDDFLQRGGDSIMAVRLLSRIRKIFQTETSLIDFLGNSTVAAFSRYLEQFPETARTAQAYLHLQGLSQQERQQLATAPLSS